MRANWFLTILIALAMALAGCSSSTDDEPEQCHEEGAHDEEGHDEAMDGDGMEPTSEAHDCPPPGTGTPTPTPPPPPPTPNVEPTLVWTIADAGGNETQATMAGSVMTFSVAGSEDADGSITGAAVTIVDGNRSNGETHSLFNSKTGQFVSADISFPTPGLAVAYFSMVDDDSGFANAEVPVYVNHAQDLGGHNMKILDPVGAATDCGGSADNAIVDQQFYHEFSFEVKNGAQWVEAMTTAGDAKIAICDPDGNALSDEGTDSISTNGGHNYTASLQYYVAAVSQAPNQDVTISVVVHYDPQA